MPLYSEHMNAIYFGNYDRLSSMFITRRKQGLLIGVYRI